MFSVIILSAGYSSRMNRHKALLPFFGDTVFLEHIIQKYLSVAFCQKIVIVVNEELSELLKSYNLSSSKIKTIVNPQSDKGRFYSIYCGVKALEDKNNAVFIHNVDNPFVNIGTINLLMQSINKYDYIIPAYKSKGGHPVLLSEKVINAIEREQDFSKNFRVFLQKFRKKYVDVNDEKVLVNINTLQDYQKLF